AAAVARASNGLPLARILLAYADWLIHLGMAPGKVAQLAELAARQRLGTARFALGQFGDTPPQRVVEPEPGDRRFNDEGWRKPPFSLIEQDFLARRQWWGAATSGVRGVSARNADMVSFFTRAAIDAASPYNFPWSNPEVLRATANEKGMNLVRGARNFLRDSWRNATGAPPKAVEGFKVGENLAPTPGKVVYRNRLIELIQYTPTTKRVHPEPVLIVPAWIMKYYILDLSAGKSMVRYLLDQGHTVFILSWKNPDADDRDLGMDDYRLLGPMAALDAINDIIGDQRKVHAMGYCVGGTLMAITAATMARDGDDRLATLTLLAAQTDFSLAGELLMFINASQLNLLNSQMDEKGYLDKGQMAGAFMLLRANDLIWAQRVNDYLLGKQTPAIDLMAWNAAATRLPYRMHREYLRKLYLQNQLGTGQYRVEGQPIAIRDIRVPIFVVGTETDHIAPWHSAYRTCLLAHNDDLSFLLTSGGHNAGIVTPPGHPRRRYRMRGMGAGQTYLPPERYYAETESEQGSWWPVWQGWLRERSGNKVAPPEMGAALCAAPGTYVFQQ
ncbi:MAG: alpha/beta fold hydrolase, partial [Salinisphaera sp.]|nr:alpha/beta fold hydrolase [Salinisphaera sp.]